MGKRVIHGRIDIFLFYNLVCSAFSLIVEGHERRHTNLRMGNSQLLTSFYTSKQINRLLRTITSVLKFSKNSDFVADLFDPLLFDRFKEDFTE